MALSLPMDCSRRMVPTVTLRPQPLRLPSLSGHALQRNHLSPLPLASAGVGALFRGPQAPGPPVEFSRRLHASLGPSDRVAVRVRLSLLVPSQTGLPPSLRALLPWMLPIPKARSLVCPRLSMTSLRFRARCSLTLRPLGAAPDVSAHGLSPCMTLMRPSRSCHRWTPQPQISPRTMKTHAILRKTADLQLGSTIICRTDLCLALPRHCRLSRWLRTRMLCLLSCNAFIRMSLCQPYPTRSPRRL